MFGWAFPASFHPLRALLIYRNQPLKPTLTFDTIDRQRDRTKKLYRTLKEPLGTTKHSSEQSKDVIGYSLKRCIIISSKKIRRNGTPAPFVRWNGIRQNGIRRNGYKLTTTLMPWPVNQPTDWLEVASFEQQYKVWTVGRDVTEMFLETFPETQCLHWPNKP